MIFVIFVALAKPRDRDFLMKFFDAFSTRCLAWRVWEAFALEKPVGNTWIDLSQTLHCPYLQLEQFFRVYWGEMSWLQLGLTVVTLGTGGVEQSETPCLRFWMYQRLASDWIWTHRYIFIRATGHFVHQDSWKYHPNMNNVVDTELSTSCSGWCWNIYLTEWLVATLYEKAPEGKMWLYYLLFVKDWFEAIPCYDKNRTPKRYTSLYDNKRLYQLKSIE